MKLSGWGRWPTVDAVVQPAHELLAEHFPGWPAGAVARGLGRSYGDASLAGHVIDVRGHSRMLDFDPRSGELTCESGVSLADIVDVFLPRGWFIPVTPGTRHVTVGGAIAADVHGKNHHQDGCFSEFVSRLVLLLPDGERVECLPGSELFRATCGGMGLTGLIIEATIRLSRVPGGAIEQLTYSASSLPEVMALFEAHAGSTYSVAWIDCLATGKARGRSLLYLGEHCEGDYRRARGPTWKRIPFDLPAFTVNSLTVRLFNELYFRLGGRHSFTTIQSINSFFYPLDAIHDWNRMYGRRGFFQYQCVVPLDASASAFDEMLGRISAAGKGSFLAVLKRMGKANDNLLSFPLEGYTLALDFPHDKKSLALAHELDRITVDHGGRIYLAKDARMPVEVFRTGYPRWQEFTELRERLGLQGRVESELSRRLEI